MFTGVIEQTLSNWRKAHKSGKLVANGRGLKLTPEQIDPLTTRRKCPLKMEGDILGKAAAYFSRSQR